MLILWWVLNIMTYVLIVTKLFRIITLCHRSVKFYGLCHFIPKRPEIRVMQQFEFETYHKCIKSLQMYLIQQNIAYGNHEETL